MTNFTTLEGVAFTERDVLDEQVIPGSCGKMPQFLVTLSDAEAEDHMREHEVSRETYETVRREGQRSNTPALIGAFILFIGGLAASAVVIKVLEPEKKR